MNALIYVFLIGLNTTFLGVGIAYASPMAFVSLFGLIASIVAYAWTRQLEDERRC
jgi:hypothetical protein